jgi:hypothetical protein
MFNLGEQRNDRFSRTMDEDQKINSIIDAPFCSTAR